MGGICEGFKQVKILSGQGVGCVVGGEEKSIRVTLLLPVFSDLSVVIFCHVEGGSHQNI